ncbi:hypothetical protein V499_07399 [Pseudogymnoascus sp. VKM F-103]|nr:hypothetical protein V499_07399 [Pseudogymnoascus sp. VKM F-103]
MHQRLGPRGDGPYRLLISKFGNQGSSCLITGERSSSSGTSKTAARPPERRSPGVPDPSPSVAAAPAPPAVASRRPNKPRDPVQCSTVRRTHAPLLPKDPEPELEPWI